MSSWKRVEIGWPISTRFPSVAIGGASGDGHLLPSIPQERRNIKIVRRIVEGRLLPLRRLWGGGGLPVLRLLHRRCGRHRGVRTLALYRAWCRIEAGRDQRDLHLVL